MPLIVAGAKDSEMNTLWRGLLADIGWGLVLGVVLTVLMDLPRQPSARGLLVNCGTTIVFYVISIRVARRLMRPKSPPA